MSGKLASLILCVGFFFLVTVVSADPLVIGRVSTTPDKAYKEVKPIVDYVVARLRDLGIAEGSVVVARNRDEMIRFLSEGKVDWTTDSVISSLLYCERARAAILLRRWAGGIHSYHSVLFARKDAGINTLQDLRGKKMAYENRGSTTSFYIPVAMISKAGIEMTEISSPKEKVVGDKVGYAFAGDELNVTTWVHRRIVDAGAYHNQDWETAETNPEMMKRDLKIFYQSKPLPRMVEVVRHKLNPKVKDRLKEILLAAHDDPEAKEALNAYHKTNKFDEFKGPALTELNEAKVLFKYLSAKVIP
jgi:phosphonate transport system substrate-binding protein